MAVNNTLPPVQKLVGPEAAMLTNGDGVNEAVMELEVVVPHRLVICKV